MDAVEALRGANANPGGAVAEQIAELKLQVAQLTQMLRNALCKLNHDIPEVDEREGNWDLVRCNKICQFPTGDTFYNSLH